jgi:SOS-response transcriptional repressor LexA
MRNKEMFRVANMSTLAKRIAEALADAKMKPIELARSVGVGRATVSLWLSGHTKKIEGPNLTKVARALNVDAHWLATGEGKKRPRSGHNVEIGPEIRGQVPLISWIQAGKWCGIVDTFRPGDGEKMIFSTKNVGPNAFALRVKGDSMESPAGRPTYPEGSIIIVDPNVQATNGSRVVVRLEASQEATFKQLVIDGGRRYLKPLNPRYPILEVTEEATICGVVVQTIIDED